MQRARPKREPHPQTTLQDCKLLIEIPGLLSRALPFTEFDEDGYAKWNLPELAKLRRNKAAYKMKILEMVHDSLVNQGPSAGFAQTMLNKIVTSSLVRESEEVSMMDHDTYVSHFMVKKRVDEDTAKSMWAEDVANRDVMKETARGEICIAVAGCKKYNFEKVNIKNFKEA